MKSELQCVEKDPQWNENRRKVTWKETGSDIGSDMQRGAWLAVKSNLQFIETKLVVRWKETWNEMEKDLKWDGKRP